jgi:hypothetical protein
LRNLVPEPNSRRTGASTQCPLVARLALPLPHIFNSNVIV